MCLVGLAVDMHPDFPVVLLGNRDEFHQRPTRAMHWWRAPRILAGRDLQAGGSWLAFAPDGRFATVTNYRDPDQGPAARSRGALVTQALSMDSQAFHRHLIEQGGAYGGYNLLWSDGEGCWYHSNRLDDVPRRLSRGVYGLSNGVLDTPWPKVAALKEALAEALETDTLSSSGCFGLLRDPRRPPDGSLPDTGVSLEWERLLSSAFIVSQAYGTRSSSAMIQRRNGRITVEERGFDPEGRETGRRLFRFGAA
ncbi:uncharacterized protein with NRDE domain [Natronocella acetinitrilica]|uniref:Uncharacterized protein with NRDE domain n=1 Tax=Natronocella acetinitrilica TaxID=414046 RepID=A0AAE3G5N4_9GAMM|nr:NRDE family protein [Natronocella acetinitrilica]MCP1676360.1 uncharacterized protein with NRDE domain [Natronocella acetinitrilica]